MGRDAIFLFTAAGISFAFALFNAVQFAIKCGKTAKTEGTILSIQSTNPANEKWRNAKWAEISYRVDDRRIVSKNRIQVPAASSVGTKLTVRYDREEPEKLYSFSAKRIVVGVFVGVCYVAVGVFVGL